MLIELQKVKKWAESQEEKANKKMKYYDGIGFFSEANLCFERKQAFSEMVEKLTLLLNTENGKGGKNEASNGGKPM